MMSLLTDFCNQTAIHGFAEIRRQKHPVSRTIWIIFITAAFFTLTGHLVLLISEYMDYNYVENLRFTENHIFPDVIFCPMAQQIPNDIHLKSSTAANKQYWKMIQNNDDFTNFTGQYLKDYLRSSEVQYINLNAEQLKIIESDIENVVMYAYYEGKSSRVEIKYPRNPLYFKCVLVSIKDKVGMNYNSGLHIGLFNREDIDNDKPYTPIIHNEVYGFKAFIEKPGGIPDPTKLSISIQGLQ